MFTLDTVSATSLLSPASNFLKFTEAVPHFLTISVFGEKGIGLPFASVKAQAYFSSSIIPAEPAAVVELLSNVAPVDKKECSQNISTASGAN
jgi:hypothetical protein